MLNLKQEMQNWKQTPEIPRRLIAFGASNTELGWHSEGCHNWVSWLYCSLRSSVGRHVTVINQGFCGDTSKGLLSRMQRDVIAFSPDIAIIMVGGNDVNAGLPAGKYKENLTVAIDTMLSHNIVPVMQTSYAYIFHHGYNRALFDAYSEVNRTLSKEFDIPIVDHHQLFIAFYDYNQEEYCQLMHDAMHVNALGNLVMGLHENDMFGLSPITAPNYRMERAMDFYTRMKQLTEGRTAE